MDARWTPEQLSESLIRACLHGPSPTDAKAPVPDPLNLPRFTVAVSREVGAHGSEVARQLGARLGWRVYDRELLEEIARDMHVRVQLLENVDERHVSWLEEFTESFLLGWKVNENTYAAHLVETLVALAARGACVIVGRGAAHLLPPSCTLRVRIVAPLEDRITTICDEQKMTAKAAAFYIAETEHQQIRFVKDHFQRDVTDCSKYDLVLNSSRWSIAECAELAADALGRLQAHYTSRADGVSRPATVQAAVSL